jgi:site-specific recombinase XerC
VSLFSIARRLTGIRGLCVAVVVVAMLAGAATNAGAGQAQTGAAQPDLDFSPTRGIGGFDGLGVQLNSEALGLRWQDLDLGAGVIRISGQLQRGERTRTKSEAGVRGIGVPEQLVGSLRQHRRTQVERGVSVAQESFVFASVTGTPMDRRRAHRVVQAAARKAKLIGKDENLRVHDLRAGFALNSLRDGMTLPELQRALGHRKADQSLSYASIVAKDAVVRSSAYDRDETADVVELRLAS